MNNMNEILPVGTIAKVRDRSASEYLGENAELGLKYCQLGGVSDSLLFGPERAAKVAELKQAAAELGITITSVWAPYPGQHCEFAEWPRYHGLVPEAFRGERFIRSCMASELAKELGVKLVAAHLGFIPDDPESDIYKSFVRDFRCFLEFCANNGQTFILETGQECVDTLERFIKDLDMPNIGLNFDPANMLMYNFDDPMVVIERLGKYIYNVHCKDGSRPDGPGKLGPEKQFGEGDINARAILEKLYETGYYGPLIIEREISGEQKKIDIRSTVEFIEKVKKELGV